MPEVVPVDENHTVTLGHSSESEIVGELFLSSDVIKPGDFNPEDHVILVVPESVEHLVTDEENGASYVIPTSEDAEVCDGLNVDPDRLRETIKSNFLVIAKLLPSKSPPPLVPILSSKLTGEEVLKVVPEEPSDVPVLHKLLSTPTPAAPKPPVKNRQPRTLHRIPGARNHTIKQEVPEIFGKMFPSSYNEVMYKQIREIIYFKCGKGATEETEVSEGINCPHCRKKPLTLVLLKEHLTNCHTYSSAKRKNPSHVSAPIIIKKTFFRCQYCDEAFISHAQRDSHECSLAVKPLEHVKDAYESITCDICHQDFGSPSELKCHQDLDHKHQAKKSAPKTYILCEFCDKRVSSSLKEEHLKRHRDHEADIQRENSRKCVKCLKPGDLNSDKVCSSCSPDVSSQVRTDQNSQDSTYATAICPTCDLEVDAASFHEHVASHRDDDDFLDHENIKMVRIKICSHCRDEFKVPADSSRPYINKCKKCRIL